jgi:ATP:ADP antiporter, AAA family
MVNTSSRLAALFNIQPGEGRLVSLFLAHYFCIGLAYIFTQTAGLALFLAEFGSANLPYAYMAIAVALALVTFLYLKLGNILALPQLLYANLGLLLLGCLAFRLGLALSESRWLAFALPIWFQIVSNLSGLAFWTLAGQVFDVRQSKRLFGLFWAGSWLASVIGGYLVAPLVAALGTPNLLVLAAAGLGVALFLQTALLRQAAAGLASAAVETSSTGAQTASPNLFRNRYALLIFGLILIWWLAYFFMDNIFYDRATRRYPDADELAGFLGVFLATVAAVGFILTSFLSGRLLSRFGLRLGLLTTPVCVTLGAGLLALTGLLTAEIALLFWLATLTKFANDALGYSLDQPTFSVLYQPLPPAARAQAQTIAEGVMQPVATGLAGALLLLFSTFLGFDAVPLALIFLVIAAIWFGIIVALLRAYPAALMQALTHRRLGDLSLLQVDETSVDVLKQGLQSRYPEAVIYSLNLLEQLEVEPPETLLPALLPHPAPEVRLEILWRIERLGLVSAREAVRQQFERETALPVREAALRTLAAVGGEQAFEQVAAYLDHPDLMLRRGALVGLFRNGGIEGVLAAVQRLITLADSPQPAERVLAAEVLGEIGAASFYQPLQKLLVAPEAEVQRAALVAAGRVKSPHLWPLVVAALDSPHFRAEAAEALVAGGEAVVPALSHTLTQTNPARAWLLRVARLCARLHGEATVNLLWSQLTHAEPEVRTEILRALEANGYRATGPAVLQVQEQVRAETGRAAQAIAALLEVGEAPAFKLLAQALTTQFQHIQTRLLYWLSFLYEPEAIQRVELALASPVGARRAYALESLDLLLPQPLKMLVFPALDDLAPAERLKRWSGVFPQPALTREQRLQNLITEGESAWLKACTLHIVGCEKLTACAPAVWASLEAPEPLVREIAAWTLAQVEAHRKESTPMLTTIEKVIILKTVTIFAEMEDAVLADLATLVEEKRVGANEVIFEKGDPGDSLYLVVTGQVRVYDGGRTLNYLGERALFGEMALLDSQPRLASVKAVEDTLLFRLSQEPFYEVLADHSPVARQVIQLLSRRLRECVKELADLTTHFNTPDSTATHDSSVFDTIPQLRRQQRNKE